MRSEESARAKVEERERLRQEAYEKRQAKAKQHDEALSRFEKEQGHTPGPEMEARKVEERGIEMARMARFKKREERDTQAARDRGELPGPGMEARKQREQKTSEADAASSKQDAEARTRFEVEQGHLPGPAMEERKIEDKGIEIARGARLTKARARERQEAIDRGELKGPAMERSKKARRDAALNRGELQGPIMEQQKKARKAVAQELGQIPGPAMDARKLEDKGIRMAQDKRVAKAKQEGKQKRADQQRENVVARELEQQKAREEGRIGPTTPERAAELRRETEKRELPQQLASGVPPAALPPTQKAPTSTPRRPTFPAGAWNQSRKTTQGGFMRVGPEQTVGGGGNLPQGRIPNKPHRMGMTHPWTLQPFYDPEIPLTEEEVAATGRLTGAWCVTIVPGFLNGHPPAIKMRAGLLPPDGKFWGNRYGNTTVGDMDPGAFVQVLLTDEPAPFLKLVHFADSRAKVFGAGGGVSGGEVPPFFRVRGAMKADPMTGLDVLNNIVINGGSEFAIRLLAGTAPTPVRPGVPDDLIPEGNRLLYKMDIVLQTDKPTIKQHFEYDDIGLLRMNGFDVVLPTHTETDYSARLFNIGIYTPPKEPDYWDIIFGTFQTYPYDEIVIGSVWLLSPVFRDNDIPDGTWNAWTRNDIFWNLNYASITQVDPQGIDMSLEYFKQILGVLAGGAAFLVAVSIVNPLEATYDIINTFMNETDVRGQFWNG